MLDQAIAIGRGGIFLRLTIDRFAELKASTHRGPGL